MIFNIVLTDDKGKNLTKIESKAAKIKLAKGPAIEEIVSPTRGLLKFEGSTGTGFPQPKPTNKRKSVPKGSRWTRGFKLTLP